MERRECLTGEDRDHFTRKTRHHSRLKDSSRVKRNFRRRERHNAKNSLRNR